MRRWRISPICIGPGASPRIFNRGGGRMIHFPPPSRANIGSANVNETFLCNWRLDKHQCISALKCFRQYQILYLDVLLTFDLYWTLFSTALVIRTSEILTSRGITRDDEMSLQYNDDLLAGNRGDFPLLSENRGGAPPPSGDASALANNSEFTARIYFTEWGCYDSVVASLRRVTYSLDADGVLPPLRHFTYSLDACSELAQLRRFA